jgi:hypothetical protein
MYTRNACITCEIFILFVRRRKVRTKLEVSVEGVLGSVRTGEENGRGCDGGGEEERPEEHSVAHQGHLLPLPGNALAALAFLHARLVPLDGGVDFVQRPQELPLQTICN